MRSALLSASILSDIGFFAVVSTASAQEAPTPPAATAPQTVVVTARRVSEATQAIGTDKATATISITRDALLSAPSGVSGLKVLESLPGFNVQANDALGLYEFGNSVFVRAFNFRQIGFVLDGVPMGRSDQFGGSPIFRYVDNENLGRVTASQGAGDVSLPSYASLGPIVQYFTVDPAKEFGASLGQTIGSDKLNRSFIKLQSGEFNGFSAYLSRSKINSNLWRGPGTIDREHVEGKIEWKGDNGARVALQGVYNDFFDFDTPAITKAQYLGQVVDPFGRSGRYWGYLGTVPDLAPTVAGIPFSNPLHNQYYLQAVNKRTDKLFSLTGSLPLTANFTLSGTTYYEDKSGYGVSPEAYATSLASYNAQRLAVVGTFAPRGLQYGLSTIKGYRAGLVTKGVLELDGHTLEAGVWVEDDAYFRTQARYNQAGGNPAGTPLLNEPVHFQRRFTSTRRTTQFFLKDTIAFFDDALKVELGFKSLKTDYVINGFRNPGDYNNRRAPRIEAKYEDTFLPQIGAVWKISRTEQIFASWSENFALPQGADDIFSAASPSAPAPAAERSTNLEIGIRTNHPTFNGSFALYKSDFTNRLQAFSSLVPGSTTFETFFQNVGSVESSGAELSGVWKPKALGGKIYFNGNVTYNKAEFKSNYTVTTSTGPTLFAIAGNTVPDSAEWLIQAGVTVEPTSWIVLNVSARYLSDRFTNFVNTEKADGYTVLNAYADIGDGFSVGPLKQVKLRFNVDNLTDESYLGTISTVTTGPATFRPGSPRTFQLTLSADL